MRNGNLIRVNRSTGGISPSRVRNYVLADGTLSVYCWCMARIMNVDAQVVRDGLTVSCGQEGCHGPH
jgi:hypothetical protein